MCPNNYSFFLEILRLAGLVCGCGASQYCHYILVTTTNGPCLSINNSLIGMAIFSVDAPEKSLNAGEHYAATGSKPLCLRSGSGEGSRPRNETNTCSQWRTLVWLPATQRTQNKFVSQIIWRLHSHFKIQITILF